MNSFINNKSGLSILEFLFISFCMLYFTIPAIEKGFGFTRFMVIEALYLVFIYITESKIVRKNILIFWALAFFIGAFYGLFKVPIGITTGSAKLKNFIDFYYFFSNMFFPVLLLYRVVTKASNIQTNALLLFCFTSAIIGSIKILEMLALNPMAARSFGHGQGGIDDEGWIAPFYFVYGMTFMALLFILFAKYAKTSWFKIVSSIIMVYLLYFLLQCQFTLSVITTFTAFIYMSYVLAKNKDERNKSLIIGALVLLLTPIIIRLLIPFLPEVISDRMSEILSITNTGELSEDTDAKGRWDAYYGAIKNFLSSPIWGVKIMTVDAHGSGLMILGDLGLLGFIPLCRAWKRMRRLIIKLIGDNGHLYRPFFFLYMINMFTNPMHASIVTDIMVGFMIPLSLIRYQNSLRIKPKLASVNS